MQVANLLTPNAGSDLRLHYDSIYTKIIFLHKGILTLKNEHPGSHLFPFWDYSARHRSVSQCSSGAKEGPDVSCTGARGYQRV